MSTHRKLEIFTLPIQREREREREKCYFNDTLNTFYLRLYGVRHMVKDHSDSEKGNPLPPHRLLLSINSKVFLYAPSHRQYSTYHSLCYTSRGALAGTRNSSMGYTANTFISHPIANIFIHSCNHLCVHSVILWKLSVHEYSFRTAVAKASWSLYSHGARCSSRVVHMLMVR